MVCISASILGLGLQISVFEVIFGSEKPQTLSLGPVCLHERRKKVGIQS